MLAGAVGLIAWHAIQDSLIAKRENLRTVEGTVVEHQASETSGTSRVKLAKGGTQSIQGNRKLKTVLRIQKRDGTIAEFSASEWFPTPKQAGRTSQSACSMTRSAISMKSSSRAN